MMYGYYSALVVRSKDGLVHGLITSMQGVHQGGTLSSLVFAMGLQPALKITARLNPEITVVAYTDDIHLAGADPVILASLQTLNLELDRCCGLTLNTAKCLALTVSAQSSDTDWSSYGLKKVPSLDSLGYSITTVYAEDALAARKCVHGVFNRISQVMESPVLSCQEKRLVSLSVSKHWITYFLPFMGRGNASVTQLLNDHDRSVSEKFLTMQGLPVGTPIQLTQLNLPTRLSGMGLNALSTYQALCLRVCALRKATSIEFPPYVKAVLSEQTDSALSELANLLHMKLLSIRSDSASPLKSTSCIRADIAAMLTSAEMSHYVHDALGLAVASTLTPLNKARCDALTLTSAQTLLTVRPYNLQTTLSDFDVKCDTSQRLGIPFDPKMVGTICMLCNMHHTYASTDHALCCPGLNNHALNLARHDGVEEALQAGIVHIGLPVEKASVFHNQQGQTQGDLLLRADRMLIDVAIKSEIATTAIHLPTGKLLKSAERLKIKKHKQAAMLNRVKVVPCVMSVFGGLGIWFRRFIQHLVTRCPRRVDRSLFRLRLRQELAVALAKGNAACCQFALDNCDRTTHLHAPVRRP